MFSYLRRKQVIQSAGIASRYFTTANSATQNVIAADARYKRSVFHSKQRGWLELDLIMGTWAKQNKDKLIADPSYLEKFETICKEENTDLMRWLCEGKPVPEKYAEDPVMKDLLNYALAQEKPWVPKPGQGNQ